MNKRGNILLFAIFFILLIGSLFILKKSEQKTPEIEQDIINDCKDLSLEKTAYCLRDNIKTFYRYNLTNEFMYSESYVVSNIKSMDELIREGGDCTDYSALYLKLGKKLGFEGKLVQYEGVRDVFYGHIWTALWDDKDICKLDLLDVNCRGRIWM